MKKLSPFYDQGKNSSGMHFMLYIMFFLVYEVKHYYEWNGWKGHETYCVQINVLNIERQKRKKNGFINIQC